MTKTNQIQLFNDRKVRTVWDSDSEEWYFSVVDVVGVLTDSADPSAYWRKLKQRLKNEGAATRLDQMQDPEHSFEQAVSDLTFFAYSLNTNIFAA